MDCKDIVFVHGWGEDSRIWEAMANHLPEFNHHYIDLGFIGNKNDSIPKTLEKAIFVSHSLGCLWTLKHISPTAMHAFAAINGFGRFTDFASDDVLEMMAKSLRRNIKIQMQMFWKNCNLPQNMRQLYEPSLNTVALSQGLSWLGSWDMRNKLQDLKDRDISVLSLGGALDLIVPVEQMQAHWESLGYDVVINEQAGHALPLTHGAWCAKQMKKTIELM